MLLDEPAILVCEGRCNPNLPSLDDAVAIYREEHRHTRTGGMEPLDLDLLTDINRLVHTRHTAAGGYHYTCSVCGTTRRFGGTPLLAEVRRPEMGGLGTW